jgi:hypothetical protein
MLTKDVKQHIPNVLPQLLAPLLNHRWLGILPRYLCLDSAGILFSILCWLCSRPRKSLQQPRADYWRCFLRVGPCLRDFSCTMRWYLSSHLYPLSLSFAAMLSVIPSECRTSKGFTKWFFTILASEFTRLCISIEPYFLHDVPKLLMKITNEETKVPKSAACHREFSRIIDSRTSR